jgi:hypothetical protein
MKRFRPKSSSLPTALNSGFSAEKPLRQRTPAGLVVLCGLIFLVGCLGLVWGCSNVARGAASDAFLDLETHLLKFETYNRSTAIATLESSAAQDLSPCDIHAQRALMLLEIPLADAALRTGAVQDFDRRSRSLEARARRTLGCSPRDSLVWLLLFGLENEHGHLDQGAFDLLAISYDTSPHEAWIGVRRIVVAVPVLLAAPEAVRARILTEFQDLVRHHFVELPARAYIDASPLVRSLLQAQIDQLGAKEKAAFTAAVEKLRS